MNQETMCRPEPDETRQRLIDAALALFGQVGYTRAATRAIAAAAGVNEVTLFRHFGSKTKLLEACVQTFNAGGFAATFEDQLTGNYAQDMMLIAEALSADINAGFEMVRLLLCDAQELPELQTIAAGGAEGNMARLAGYFRRQIEAGVVRQDLDPAVAAQAFDSLISWPVFMQRIMPGGAAPQALPSALVRGLVDIFVQGTIRQQA